MNDNYLNENESKKKNGFFCRIGIALGNFPRYKELADEKVSRTISTFIIIIIIQLVILCSFWGYNCYKFLSLLEEKYNQYVPEFSLSKEGLVIDREEPYVYNDDDYIFLFIADDSLTDEEIEDVYSEKVHSAQSYILISKEGMSTKNDGEKRNLKFAEMMEESILDKKIILNNVKTFLKSTYFIIIVLTVFIVLLIFVIIAKLIGGLIYGLIAMLIASIQGKNIKFRKLFNIAMYATVLPILIGLVESLLLINIPYSGLINIVITCVYIALGIKYIEDDDKNNKVEAEVKVEDINAKNQENEIETKNQENNQEEQETKEEVENKEDEENN